MNPNIKDKLSVADQIHMPISDFSAHHIDQFWFYQ